MRYQCAPPSPQPLPCSTTAFFGVNILALRSRPTTSPKTASDWGVGKSASELPACSDPAAPTHRATRCDRVPVERRRRCPRAGCVTCRQQAAANAHRNRCVPRRARQRAGARELRHRRRRTGRSVAVSGGEKMAGRRIARRGASSARRSRGLPRSTAAGAANVGTAHRIGSSSPRPAAFGSSAELSANPLAAHPFPQSDEFSLTSGAAMVATTAPAAEPRDGCR